MDIIDKVDELLKERGLTAKALAEGIDVSTGNISDWRSRRAKPNTEVLSRIADYFGVSTDYLLGKNDLIDLYVKSIRIWANNSFFKDEETKRIIEHFEETLMRYKEFVNYICDLCTNGYRDRGIDEIRKETNNKLTALFAWIGRLPDYYFGEYTPNTLPAALDSRITLEELDHLSKIRSLPPEKRSALETLLG